MARDVVALRLGPTRYDLAGAELPAGWSAFLDRDGEGDGARAVRVASARRPLAGDPRVCVVGTRVRGAWFELDRAGDVDAIEVYPPPAGAPQHRDAGLRAALAALVALDAPARGFALIHAAAVVTRAGAVLLVAAPGTGKSTAARAAGPHALAYNTVLVRASSGPDVWAMPFGDPDDPPIGTARLVQIAGIALLERANRARLESVAGARATMDLVRAVLCPAGADAERSVATQIALELALAVPVVRLGSPGDASYLPLLETM